MCAVHFTGSSLAPGRGILYRSNWCLWIASLFHPHLHLAKNILDLELPLSSFVLIFPLLILNKMKGKISLFSEQHLWNWIYQNPVIHLLPSSLTLWLRRVSHIAVENDYCSTDYSISSESSNNSWILSYLPIFPERTTWQIQSNSAPNSLEKEFPKSRSQSTPLPTLQLMDNTEKSDLFQNFAVLPPLQAHSSFNSSILQPLDTCKHEITKKREKNSWYLLKNAL